MAQAKVLVTGAGGFIGHHLVSFLKDKGYWVRGVDIKHPEFAPTDADEFELLDLQRWDNCLQATRGAAVETPADSGRWVYTATEAMPAGAMVRIAVPAEDRPGGAAQAEQEKAV
jgi:nucleoside-diphosphate-sugar epimerase